MSYRLLIRRDVQQQMNALPGNVRQRLRRFINDLPDNPRPSGASHLRGYPHIWRYRLERWRVVWRIYDDDLFVVIVKVGRKQGPEFYTDVVDTDE